MINSGGPAVDGFVADTGFSGGILWTHTSAGYVELGPGVWHDLRFDPAFSYTIPLVNGSYKVLFYLMEPNKTGTGQRRFTITINGQVSPVFDLFQLAGLRQQYKYSMGAFVGNGVLRIDFRATVGNAVVSAIEIRPMVSEGITTSTLQDLPATCGGRVLLYYVTNASTSTGGLPFYLCGPDDRWRQLGYQGDGTGVHVVFCDEPGVCLIGPNTSIISLSSFGRVQEEEIPDGFVDGTNTVFTLQNTPVPQLSLQIFLNGLKQTIDVDYTNLFKTVTFNIPPSLGSVLRVRYKYELPAEVQ